jgi:hypothetical protein
MTPNRAFKIDELEVMARALWVGTSVAEDSAVRTPPSDNGGVGSRKKRAQGFQR